MPEVCGRICPQDRLCEKFVIEQSGHGTVTMAQLKNISQILLGKKDGLNRLM